MTTLSNKRLRLRAEDFRIGWICALEIETAAARYLLDEEYDDIPEAASHILGRYGLHHIVITSLPAGQYGTVAAAGTLSNLRHLFTKLEFCLMVGIAGGVPSATADIRLGDVVIGIPGPAHGGVKQYDLGKTNSGGQSELTGFLNAPPHTLLSAVTKFRSNASSGRWKFFQTTDAAAGTRFDSALAEADRLYDQDGLEVVRPVRLDAGPKVHCGLIASGNQVIKDGVTRDRLSVDLGTVLCFEMEGAGLMNLFPCLVIRGISDYADAYKHKSWQPVAAYSAAVCAKEILACVPAINQQAESLDLPTAINECDTESQAGSFNPQTTRALPISDAQVPQKKSLVIHKPLTAEQEKAFLASLNFDQIEARHDTIQDAHKTTCSWILGHHSFERWMNRAGKDHDGEFFWIKGNPGTGKSTMMKYIRAQLIQREPDSVVVAFFFNARGSKLEMTTNGMYRSMLLQLLEQSSQSQKIFQNSSLFLDGNEGFRYDTKALLKAAVEKHGSKPLYLMADALDECDDDDVVDMIDYIQDISQHSLSAGANLRICFSSRHYPNVTAPNSIDLVLQDQSGHEKDLATYLGSKLVIGDDFKAEQLKREVLRKASGIFLWVVLVVPMLNAEWRRGRVSAMKARLQGIPSRLADLFNEILNRDGKLDHELVSCLQWVLFAARPMSLNELYVAIKYSSYLNTNDHEPAETASKSVMESYVLDISRGLVQQTKEAVPTMQFIHESIRDFLLKDVKSNDPDSFEANFLPSYAEDKLKDCCGSFLKHFDLHHAHATTTSASYPDAQSQFYDYCVMYLLYHAERAHVAGVSQKTFLGQFDWQAFLSRMSESSSPLHLLAAGGLPNLIAIMRDRNPEIDTPGGVSGFPLLAAGRAGNKSAVVALLEPVHGQQTPTLVKKICNDIQSENSRVMRDLAEIAQEGTVRHDCLVAAVLSCGHTELAQALIDTGHVNSTPFVTALMAASHIHPKVRSLLTVAYSKHVSANVIPDGSSERPVLGMDETLNARLLRASVYVGAQDVLELLLAQPTSNAIIQNPQHYNLLATAAFRGHTNIVRTRLSRTSLDRIRDEPLYHAARYGHFEIVRLLVEDRSFDDVSHATYLASLRSSINSGHLGIVQFLLSARRLPAIDIFTCMEAAVSRGRVKIMKTLLSMELVAIIDMTETLNFSKWRALVQKAVDENHADMLELMLDHQELPGPTLQEMFDAACGSSRLKSIQVLNRYRDCIGTADLRPLMGNELFETLRTLLKYNNNNKNNHHHDHQRFNPSFHSMIQPDKTALLQVLEPIVVFKNEITLKSVVLLAQIDLRPIFDSLLSTATFFGRAEIVKMLVTNTDRLMMRCSCALSIALTQKHTSIIALLVSRANEIVQVNTGPYTHSQLLKTVNDYVSSTRSQFSKAVNDPVSSTRSRSSSPHLASLEVYLFEDYRPERFLETQVAEERGGGEIIDLDGYDSSGRYFCASSSVGSSSDKVDQGMQTYANANVSQMSELELPSNVNLNTTVDDAGNQASTEWLFPAAGSKLEQKQIGTLASEPGSESESGLEPESRPNSTLRFTYWDHPLGRICKSCLVLWIGTNPCPRPIAELYLNKSLTYEYEHE